MIAANMVSLIPAGIIEAAGGLGIVLVIWGGGGMALDGAISVADLFVFIVYLGHIYQPFLQLATLHDVLQKAAASTERIFELLAIQPEITDAPEAAAPDRVAWDIRFQGVTFGYEADAPVLHGVDLEVEAGTVVALVGPTGAGKTTIAHLVPRFYDPQQGAVRIGGHDVRGLPLDYLRGHVALVLQDVFLFHGTVRDNLLIGRPEATEEEMREAARAANAEPFILDLSQGYDSVIGERGVRLSGGQKQRLSIARALLKDAPILILDEATSALDSASEHVVQEALAHLMQDRTTLVIAHRLSTVRHASTIVVLHEGAIAEMGTHDELLAKKGYYRQLYMLQFKHQE
jgi:ABC-type multidrug transport system fused ATPase/permease subunit